jgi:hypothetical protein
MPCIVLDDGTTMINNRPIYDQNFVDFQPLEQECAALGTAMRFSDVDQERERRHRTLRLEWKSLGVRIPDGQRFTFEHLAYLTLTTTIIVWGSGGIPSAVQIVGQMSEPQPCTLHDLARICLDWEAWALAQPKPDVSYEFGAVVIRTTLPWRWQG